MGSGALEGWLSDLRGFIPLIHPGIVHKFPRRGSPGAHVPVRGQRSTRPWPRPSGHAAPPLGARPPPVAAPPPRRAAMTSRRTLRPSPFLPVAGGPSLVTSLGRAGRSHVWRWRWRWRCRHELPRALRRLGAARRGQGDARQGGAGAGTALRDPRPPPPRPSSFCVRPAGAAQRGGAEGSHRGGAGQAGVSRGSGRDSPPLPDSAARRARRAGEGGPGTGEARPGGAGPVRGAAAASTNSSWRHRAKAAWRPGGPRASGGTSDGVDGAAVVDVSSGSLELLFPAERITALGL